MDKKKKNQYRTERINLRFTKEEKEFIDERKKQHKAKCYSDFVLSVIANQKCFIIDTNPLLAVASEINAVGQNVNQIAKVANITHSIYEKDITKLKERIDEIESIVSRYLDLSNKARDGKLNGLYKDIAD
ncbi:MAG: plasmid mobilization relaxosome protein MobC [Firmicutes bacterium]|nr:plasmid mobilization relaxosome protein MobC [Bacillota bacterium]